MKQKNKTRLKYIIICVAIILIFTILIFSYFKITGKITIPSTSITTTCADNDNTNITNANDQSYYKKSSVNSTVSYSGTTTTNYINDSCYSSTQLYERYCVGNYANTKTFYCAYGCLNGACKGAAIKSGEPFEFGSYQLRFADGSCGDNFDSKGIPIEFVISNGTMTKCCRFANSIINSQGVCIQNDGRTLGKYLEMPVIYNNETSLECGAFTLKTYDVNYLQFKDPIEQPAIGYTAQFNMRMGWFSILVPVNSYKFNFNLDSLPTPSEECFTLYNGEYVFDETKCDLRPQYLAKFPCYSGTNTKTIRILSQNGNILCSKSVGALCN